MWLNVKILLECGYLLSLAKDMAYSFSELLTLFTPRSKKDLLVSEMLGVTTLFPTLPH